jgi:hypothetical protein
MGACVLTQCVTATPFNSDKWDINVAGCNNWPQCCESGLNGGWYRLTGNDKSLVTGDPGPMHCGTAASGWLKGTLPTAGNVATLTECYDWAGNTCNWSNSVQVANCVNYYVYTLSNPPVCNLAYCVH